MAAHLLRPLAVLYNRLPVTVQRAILAAGHVRFLVGVVGVGVDGAGRLVLARHRFGSPVWRFLGGLLAPSEDPAAALAREIREETGLAVAVGPLLEVSNGRRWRHVEIVFAYRVSEPLPRAATDELLEVAAFAPDALPPMRADHRQLLERHAAAVLAWSGGA